MRCCDELRLIVGILWKTERVVSAGCDVQRETALPRPDRRCFPAAEQYFLYTVFRRWQLPQVIQHETMGYIEIRHAAISVDVVWIDNVDPAEIRLGRDRVDAAAPRVVRAYGYSVRKPLIHFGLEGMVRRIRARLILGDLHKLLIRPASILIVGCGVGAWQRRIHVSVVG